MSTRMSYFVSFWATMVVLMTFNDAAGITAFTVIGFGMCSVIAIGVQMVIEKLFGERKE